MKNTTRTKTPQAPAPPAKPVLRPAKPATKTPETETEAFTVPGAGKVVSAKICAQIENERDTLRALFIEAVERFEAAKAKTAQTQRRANQWRKCAANLIDYAHECTGTWAWKKGYPRYERELAELEAAINNFRKLERTEKP